MTERVGIEFVKLRQNKGVTQVQVAQALGITDHTVRNWEKGRAVPRLSIPQVKALCALLDCGVHELPDDFASITQAND